MIFIDGIGIGEKDQEKNPFARFPSPFFASFKGQESNSIPFDGDLVATDPSMGVKGLPQSATGQTALLTGVNASQVLGRHLSGFPGPTLRKIIQEESLFLKLERRHKKGTFANAFSPEYFQRPDRRISATTWSLKASGFPFRMVQNELMHSQAISHDLTNEFLSTLDLRVPIRTPEESAAILVEIIESVDFCLFEFILTDTIGHSQDMLGAETILLRLHAFLDTILSKIDLSKHLVLLTSDHGNFEDLSISTHTENWVPTILWGKGREDLRTLISRVEDVPGAILAWIDE